MMRKVGKTELTLSFLTFLISILCFSKKAVIEQFKVPLKRLLRRVGLIECLSFVHSKKLDYFYHNFN